MSTPHSVQLASCYDPYGVYVFASTGSVTDVIHLPFDVGHRRAFVYTLDIPKTDGRRQHSGVSDPGINYPVSKSQLAKGSHSDLGLKPGHSAGISWNGEGAETRAVSTDPVHTTRCKSQINPEPFFGRASMRFSSPSFFFRFHSRFFFSPFRLSIPFHPFNRSQFPS